MGANPWSQAAVTGASAFASGFYAEYERSVQISARYEMVSETTSELRGRNAGVSALASMSRVVGQENVKQDTVNLTCRHVQCVAPSAAPSGALARARAWAQKVDMGQGARAVDFELGASDVLDANGTQASHTAYNWDMQQKNVPLPAGSRPLPGKNAVAFTLSPGEVLLQLNHSHPKGYWNLPSATDAAASLRHGVPISVYSPSMNTIAVFWYDQSSGFAMTLAPRFEPVPPGMF